jgi:hypothetical protein
VSLELWNTIATTGTFLVIAATAVAAMVQLRHARGGNQIAALNELRSTHESPAFGEAIQFILVDLEKALTNPAFRYQVGSRDARTSEWQPSISKIELVGNFYEVMGMIVKIGLIDRSIVLEIWSELVTIAWQRLAPVTAIQRRTGGSGLWENFEYLVVLSQDWLAANPTGTYPRNVRRIELKDDWLQEDEHYERSQNS